MSLRCAISQSNYLPWKGYFDLIRLMDRFVLYDSVQYTRRDWRNRNRIKTAAGVQWLTVPVEVKGKYLQTIRETVVSDPEWARVHWRTLEHAYGKTPYFRQYAEELRTIYATFGPKLSDVNYVLLTYLCRQFDIHTPILWDSEFDLSEPDPSLRLLSICKQIGADEYWSGPAAKAYLNVAAFEAAGVSVEWKSYAGYPEYPQHYPPFDHAVSALDVLFHMGPDSPKYLQAEALCGSPS